MTVSSLYFLNCLEYLGNISGLLSSQLQWISPSVKLPAKQGHGAQFRLGFIPYLANEAVVSMLKSL